MQKLPWLHRAYTLGLSQSKIFRILALHITTDCYKRWTAYFIRARRSLAAARTSNYYALSYINCTHTHAYHVPLLLAHIHTNRHIPYVRTTILR